MDGALLAALPDNVKLKILASLGGNDTGASLPSVLAAQPAAAADATAIKQSSDTSSGPPAAMLQGHTLLERQTSAFTLQLPLLAGMVVSDGFLPPEEVQAAATAAELYLQQRGRKAGLGGADAQGKWHNSTFRGDVMQWLKYEDLQQQEAAAASAGQGPCFTDTAAAAEEQDTTAAEAAGPLLNVLQRLEGVRHQLLQAGYDVGGKSTYQLACYPGDGSRYVRHADASPSCPTRAITAIAYLNPSPAWRPLEDGGQLAVYNVVPPAAAAAVALGGALGAEGGEPHTLVAPMGGRLVVFESSIDHEVLPTRRHRCAITAWFHRSPPQPPAPAPSAPSAPSTPTALVMGPLPPPITPHAAAPRVGPQRLEGGRGLILVLIAAYRDPECQWTIHDLFTKADAPGRLRVGVVWQTEPSEDAAIVRIAGLGLQHTASGSGSSGSNPKAQWARQVREIRLPAHESDGPCRARYLAQQLWGGEEYVLQIDSHMRFIQGWDSACLQQLAQAQAQAQAQAGGGAAKVVLSTYPPSYTGEGAAAAIPQHAPPTMLCAQGFGPDGLLRITGRSLRPPPTPPHPSSPQPPSPLPALFWAAGFSFSHASLLLEVPYCPLLPHLFFGEETYMLARMWSSGWDVYAPGCAIAFHQWQRSERAATYQRDRDAGKLQAQTQVQGAQGVQQVQQVGAGAAEARPSGAAPCASAASASAPSAATGAGAGASSPGAVEGRDGAMCRAWQEARSLSRQRVLSVLGCGGPDEAGGGVSGAGGGEWGVGSAWGLGTARSLTAFEAHVGVCFARRSVSERAVQGGLSAAHFME